MGAVVELTNEEWAIVEHLFDPLVHRGVKCTIPRREMVTAILWVARTGCQWRYLPARYPDWQAVWSQWRRWRDKGTWAAAMRVLAREIRLRHDRKADPTMVMIDGQTVKGGRAGPTFHEAGGRGGYTRGAKRTLLIEILGLPLAVSVESARPHDVQSARRILKEQLDPKHPTLSALRAIVADRGYTGLAALAAGHGLKLDIKRPPAPTRGEGAESVVSAHDAGGNRRPREAGQRHLSSNATSTYSSPISVTTWRTRPPRRRSLNSNIDTAEWGSTRSARTMRSSASTRNVAGRATADGFLTRSSGRTLQMVS